MGYCGSIGSIQYHTCLMVGSSLLITAIGVILVSLISLRESSYHQVVFSNNDSQSLAPTLPQYGEGEALPLVPLIEISPLRFKTFVGRSFNYDGPFRITTANVGMFPAYITTTQEIAHKVSGFLVNQLEELLPHTHHRIEALALKLSEEAEAVPILCCQELFDHDAAHILARTLVEHGYTVLHDFSDRSSFLNSGLLFASRYPINAQEVRFWRFTNPTCSDAFASKGLLRIPFEIELQRQKLEIIIYTTHLQAQTSEKQIRKEQLQGILSVIQQDHAQNSKRVIFLAGDLNITDIEYDGSLQNEYTEHNFFFSHFRDFLQDKYANSMLGTFYQMDVFGTGKTAPGCLYDRILLYKGDENLSTQEHSIEIRTFLAERLSDHLPVTFTLS